MRTATVRFALAALVLASLPGAARAASPAFIPLHLTRPATSCPALFGDEAKQQAARARRAALIHWVANDAGTITVAHASDRWDEPTRLRLDGLRVMLTGRGQATIEVSAALAQRSGCRPGSYSVGRDMSIGGAAVIGVLPDGLLLERRGRLRFLARAGTRTPEWQMIWGSPYEVVVSATPESGLSRYAHIIF